MNNLIGISGKKGSGKDTVGKMLQILSVYPATTEVYGNIDNAVKISEVSPYKIRKFADKLKDIVCMLIGCTREQLEDEEFKNAPLGEEWWHYTDVNNGFIHPYIGFLDNDYLHMYELTKLTPRIILQQLGTDCMRNIIHPDIHVNATFSKYKESVRVRGACVPSGADGMYMIPKGHGVHSFKTTLYKKYFEYNLDKPVYPKWIITDVRFPNEAEAIKDRGGKVYRVNRKIREFQAGFTAAYYPPLDGPEHYSETALDDYTGWDGVLDNNEGLHELFTQVKEKIYDPI